MEMIQVTINKLEKIIAIGTVIGMLVSAVTYISMFMPDYVEAGEFNEFKLETYNKQLRINKSDLMDLEVRIWQAQQDKEILPPAIKKKQLQLTDDIAELEKNIMSIESSKTKAK